MSRASLCPLQSLARASLLLLAALLAPLACAQSQLQVVDDVNKSVVLPSPARRIVSLAPHATEMLFAIGAGSSVAGVLDHSDFPPEVRNLPTVGNAAYFDLDRIAALRPQLVVAWGSGNDPARLAQLNAMGIPVFVSQPRDFEAIASNMERLGILTGTAQAARGVAASFRQQIRDLQAHYANRAPVRVFYQIWDAPLMTLNDGHLISHAMATCGGVNVFGPLPQLAPAVGVDDVLQQNPEVIVLATGGDDAAIVRGWQRFPQITAVARGNLFVARAEWLSRPGPRVAQGTDAMCRALEIARSRR